MINMRMLFLFNTIRKSYPMCIRNFKILGEVVPEKFLTKHFIREKEKWKNNGTDKHEDAGSFFHDTKGRIQCLYQISKS